VADHVIPTTGWLIAKLDDQGDIVGQLPLIGFWVDNQLNCIPITAWGKFDPTGLYYVTPDGRRFVSTPAPPGQFPAER